MPDSPAIDAGDDIACPDIDQRGIPRPQGVACDMGAYEFGDPPPSSCTLILAPSYAGGVLIVDVTIGTSVAATINVWGTAQSNIIALASSDMPITDPPIIQALSQPVPPQGSVGLLATMTTPEDGIICSAFETVDTG